MGATAALGWSRATTCSHAKAAMLKDFNLMMMCFKVNSALCSTWHRLGTNAA
jgi:hypothetical protein